MVWLLVELETLVFHRRKKTQVNKQLHHFHFWMNFFWIDFQLTIVFLYATKHLFSLSLVFCSFCGAVRAEESHRLAPVVITDLLFSMWKHRPGFSTHSFGCKLKSCCINESQPINYAFVITAVISLSTPPSHKHTRTRERTGTITQLSLHPSWHS